MENKMPTAEQMKMIMVAEESDGVAAAALLGLLPAGAGVAAMVMVTIVAKRAIVCIVRYSLTNGQDRTAEVEIDVKFFGGGYLDTCPRCANKTA